MYRNFQRNKGYVRYSLWGRNGLKLKPWSEEDALFSIRVYSKCLLIYVILILKSWVPWNHINKRWRLLLSVYVSFNLWICHRGLDLHTRFWIFFFIFAKHIKYFPPSLTFTTYIWLPNESILTSNDVLHDFYNKQC